MARSIRTTILGVLVTMAAAACGESTEEKQLPTGTSVTSSIPAAPVTPETPATTDTPAQSEARGCAAILADGLQLARDYSNEQRGIVAPDEAAYRARAQILVDEARGLGCPIPTAAEEFLR